MQRSIRIRHWLLQLPADTKDAEDNCITRLYLPSSWIPPLALPSIEKRLLQLENELRQEVKRRPPSRSSNLDFFQTRALKVLLRDRTDLHISNGDKNIGPVVRNKIEYMESMYTNHNSTKAYKRLTKEEAADLNQKNRTEVKAIMHRGCGANKAVLACSTRSIQRPTRDAQTYGLPKLHKDPIVDIPIISGINSIVEGISKIADYYMKKIIPHTPTHLRDSQSLVNTIHSIGPLPPKAKLFTANATTMYTNIQPDVGIPSIESWMKAYPEKVPADVPKPLLLKLLEIIMQCNIFSFDNTDWLQEIGTAMGTPCACSYATLSYTIHEIQAILAKFAEFLLLLKRFIDDIFGIWINGPGEEWENFKMALEGFGQLKWISSDLEDIVVFLNLTLSINIPGIIERQTFIKPKNLHLYIPAMSAHPPGCFKYLATSNSIGTRTPTSKTTNR
jgi:hypothetical protein